MFKRITPVAAFSGVALYLALNACEQGAATRSRQPASVELPQSALPSAATAPAAPTTPAESSEPSSANAEALGENFVPALMTQHFLLIRWARDSVIEGAVEALRKPMRALAEYRYPADFPQSWAASLTRLQELAQLTAEAGSLELAATGVAGMARVCGDCHLENSGPAALGGQPTVPSQADTDTSAQPMQRHIWALDRMWIGLTDPSDAAWRAGAAALAAGPIQLNNGRTEAAPGFRTSLHELRALGARAQAAKSSEERADVYGRTLATCAHCHASSVEPSLAR